MQKEIISRTVKAAPYNGLRNGEHEKEDRNLGCVLIAGDTENQKCKLTRGHKALSDGHIYVGFQPDRGKLLRANFSHRHDMQSL